MNPEFLRQGSAYQDTLNADRVVIDSYDKRSGDALEELYKGFISAHIPPIIRTALFAAELIKYAGNAMLATKSVS
jgi:UDPglucose 6-dehydrogenase